jgi:hypothetical protein
MDVMSIASQDPPPSGQAVPPAADQSRSRPQGSNPYKGHSGRAWRRRWKPLPPASEQG